MVVVVRDSSMAFRLVGSGFSFQFLHIKNTMAPMTLIMTTSTSTPKTTPTMAPADNPGPGTSSLSKSSVHMLIYPKNHMNKVLTLKGNPLSMVKL